MIIKTLIELFNKSYWELNDWSFKGFKFRFLTCFEHLFKTRNFFDFSRKAKVVIKTSVMDEEHENVN